MFYLYSKLFSHYLEPMSQPMKFKLVSLLIIVSFSFPVLGQKSKRRGTVRKPVVTTPQPQPVAQPPATSKPARQPAAPTSLVIVNGQTLTTADLQPALRQDLERLDDKIAEARAAVLDQQINTLLLQAEAKKRNIDTPRLYALEVTNRVPVITQAQIKKFIEDNRQQLEGVDPAAANEQVSVFLREESENKLADDFVKRLRKTHPVVMGVDINSANLSPNAVIATVAGFPLKADSLIERLKPIIYKMRLEAYELTKKQTDQLVNDMLLLEEARRRQIGPEEIVRAEITDKVRSPTEEEVAKFYSDNKARISGDLNSVRNQVVSYLQEQARQNLEKDLSDRLRKGANIRWLISEPVPPIQNISADDDPSRGQTNAPVTIVEFTDFQCPACAAMHPVLEEVLKSYSNKVRLVVRDFPLNQHENARKAAEAANAAHAQGKFFEYAALLFKNQKALDVPSLKKYASELGLNRVRFDAELDRGIYAAEIKKDIEDGEIYGVGSTPTIFINGLQLRTLSPEALREAIDRAAGSPAKPNSSQK
jgi:protein-disulfide isomerase